MKITNKHIVNQMKELGVDQAINAINLDDIDDNTTKIIIRTIQTSKEILLDILDKQ